jgi:hypothetical protein
MATRLGDGFDADLSPALSKIATYPYDDEDSRLGALEE